MKEISLSKGQIAFIDDVDWIILQQFKWYSKNGYAVRNVTVSRNHREQIRMHNVIMNPTEGMEVDHINGNGLDNRRENLRIVTHRQNGQNRHEEKTSHFPGVCFFGKKWRADIKMNGENKYLGSFDDEIQAARTYDIACLILEHLEVYQNVTA